MDAQWRYTDVMAVDPISLLIWVLIILVVLAIVRWAFFNNYPR